MKKILGWIMLSLIVPFVCLLGQFVLSDKSILSIINLENNVYLSAFFLGFIFEITIAAFVAFIIKAINLIES